MLVWFFLVWWQVIRLLRPSAGANNESRKSLHILDRNICQNAFCKLYGVGSDRFRKLWACAKNGIAAPMDGRAVRNAFKHSSGVKSMHRQKIIEFLQELYDTLSEPMPEAKGPVRGDRRLAFQRRRGRRPRMAAQLHRKQDTPDMRLLPPGTFSDYLNMLKVREGCEKISLKLFTAAACMNLCLLGLAIFNGFCHPQMILPPDFLSVLGGFRC